VIILGPLGLILIGVIVVAVVLLVRSSRGPVVTMTAADQRRAMDERRSAVVEANRALAAWKRDPSDPSLAALEAANERLRATGAGVPIEGQAAPDDPIDQIRRLAELRDQGAITPEEFEAKKRELLGKIT
jgi:hypothetical protein